MGAAAFGMVFQSAAGSRHRLMWGICSLCLVLVGCSQETSFLDPATQEPGGGGEGIQRTTLTVTVRVGGPDSALAAKLGATQGVLPSTEVTIQRSGADASSFTGTTDANGEVRFEDLLEGDYSVSLVRILTAEERARFDSADADVNAFGGGAFVRDVEAPAAEAVVAATAGRRGSLVISELSVPIARLSSGEDYINGEWIEVFNNSDTTIYLDGKVIVRAITFVRDREPGFDCESHAEWQLDPEGLWTNRLVEAFPGGGTTHPLEPGAHAVVAQDAVDHRQFHEGLKDLSNADFEFIGSADADNPSVPNMVRLGRSQGGGVPQLSHGLSFGSIDIIAVVADEVNVGSLVRDDIPLFNNPESWRIPADRILDVLATAPTPSREASFTFLSPQCPKWLDERFDRQRAALVDGGALNAITRRTLTTLPSGQRILLRTKTSARDFQTGVGTPGR